MALYSATLDNALRKMKAMNLLSSKGVDFYYMNISIHGQDCDSQYIGETGRSLGRRVTEHKYTVKTGDLKNVVAVHAWNEGHRVNWEVEVLECEQI